jgi:hypothetical protein
MAYGTNSLSITGTLIENDLKSGNALLLHNVSGVTAAITGSSVFGLNASQILNGPGTVTGMTYLATEPVISIGHPW